MPDTHRRTTGYRRRVGPVSRRYLVRRIALGVTAALFAVWVAGGAAGPRATVTRLGTALGRIAEVATGGADDDQDEQVDAVTGRTATGGAADAPPDGTVGSLGAAAVGGGTTAEPPVGPPSTDTSSLPSTAPMATLGDLTLRVPAERAELVAIHEAAAVRARPLVPSGALVRGGNDNATRHAPGDDADPAGVPYRVQVSRGRVASPTSAIDVVLADDVAVRSPVEGTVVGVREYRLYGRHDDVRIEVRPDDAPALVVIMIHVTDPTVVRGQRVAAGEVVAGGARRFEFSSIVDNLVAPAQLGHVHLEVARLDQVRARRRAEAAASETAGTVP